MLADRTAPGGYQPQFEVDAVEVALGTKLGSPDVSHKSASNPAKDLCGNPEGGVAVDTVGNIYVVDNYRVLKPLAGQKRAGKADG